jgi:hypothetical protein
LLQINTGKLYGRGVGRRNQLTGVLYSNVRLPLGRVIVTDAGTLKSTGFGLADMALVYDLEERIEAYEDGPGILVSHTVGPYLDEFATIASFGLEAIVSGNAELVRNLIGGRPGYSSFGPPGDFVSRVFDQSAYITDEKAAEFESFVENLLALDRKTYLAAMRAIRTFVAGIQRIPDDLPLAYTMIVSSTESLAQDFDGFEPTWPDIEERKRRAIDEALKAADKEVSTAVRNALLLHEHTAIARRYRAFMLSYADDLYFRREDVAGARPVARHELEEALRQTYNLRSAFVHRLSTLPTSISHPHGHWESTTVDRRPVLTFQGLYHLTHRVIEQFVKTGTKVKTESYDYTLELSGVISVEFAPQYWIWQPLIDATDAKKRLEGLVSLLHGMLNGEKVELGDMRPVLSDVERLLPQAPGETRSSLLLFHILTNRLFAAEHRSPNADQFFAKHCDEAFAPGPEALIVGTYTGAVFEWPLDLHASALEQYFEERVRKSGLHAPRILEAAAALALGERYRSGNDENSARHMIGRAVEADPGNTALRRFECDWRLEQVIDWTLLLPKKQDPEVAELSDSP